jgi:hypothetical protein
MTPLIETTGKHVASPEAMAALAPYPDLRPESDDFEPGEGPTPVHYLRSEPDGLLIKLSAEGEILAIFLMAEGKEGFRQFQGELPGQLTFASQPSDVLKKLGAPAFNRPPGKIGSYRHGELFRYDKPGYSLHFQFRGDRGGIELITAMAARVVPGRTVA